MIEHRLLCGDATMPEDVARALDGRQASLCFTDPPYNVAMGDHGGQGRRQKKRRIANDAMDPIAWEAFVRGFTKTILSSTDGAIYICMSSKEWPTLARVLTGTGGVERFEIVATRAGRRIEVTTGRGIVEVAEVTRAGNPVRSGRFMANRVVALVEHPASESGVDEAAARHP